MKNEQLSNNPEIEYVCTDQLRLIDKGMLHYESSVAGYNERYHRGETSHTIHVWWARRPHSAMRSVVFASLCKNLSNASSELMAELAISPSEYSVSKARKQIQEGYESAPRLLDMFGGGGTIPFEAKRLGCDTYSIDANQLSVFIQKCNLQYSDNIDIEVAKKKIHTSGEKVLNHVKERTNWLYPLRTATEEKCFGYIWTYSEKCESCGSEFLLTKRHWLSKKAGKRISVCINNDDDNCQKAMISYDGEPSFSSNWNGRKLETICPFCGHHHTHPNALKCSDKAIATISLSEKTGKVFSSCETGDVCPSKEDLKTAENELLNIIGTSLPNSKLPKWSGIVNPAMSGIETHADFVNPRQRLLLLYLIDELTNEYEQLKKDNLIMAKFVIGVLSSLIDQVVDWNCRLSMWIPQNEQVGRAFCGPGVAMYWDYAETDQLLNGPANLWSKLARIEKGVASMAHEPGRIDIQHAVAQNLPYEDKYFDAIVTDPPYYDNIYYSILADFFYAWKKPLLVKVEPDLFSNAITDYSDELVASARRSGGERNAYEQYCTELNKAFSEASRVLKDDGVFSFVYSHASVDAWMAVIGAYRSTSFHVSSVQPLSIERKGRPRAITSKAVNTCVTIVARKNKQSREQITGIALLEELKIKAIPFGKYLVNELDWENEDAGMATIAWMVGAIANTAKIKDATSDKDYLIEVAGIVSEHFPGFRLTNRGSL